MKKNLIILSAVCMPFIIFAQSIGDYIAKVDTLANILAGVVTMVLTEVFTNYTGTTKTNALISALCIAAAIGGALILYGVPSIGIGSIFTIASGLFAIYRKLSGSKAELRK